MEFCKKNLKSGHYSVEIWKSVNRNIRWLIEELFPINAPFREEAQTALFKDPVRTAL